MSSLWQGRVLFIYVFSGSASPGTSGAWFKSVKLFILLLLLLDPFAFILHLLDWSSRSFLFRRHGHLFADCNPARADGPFHFHPWLSLTLLFSVTLCLVSGGGGVFFLSVFWCWVELMLLFPENGHCGAVKEAMGAWDLILLLDVWPCMEKAMAPHSSTLAWKSPRIEEPGGLQSMGSLGVRHDWATSLSPFTFMHWRRKWQPTPVFLPGESQGRGNLLGCRLWGRTESDTAEVT